MVTIPACHAVWWGFESPRNRKINQNHENGKLDWVASIPVRVGHEDKSLSGPARRDEDFLINFLWPYRLSVRTSGFRPEKEGSTPSGATKLEYMKFHVEKWNQRSEEYTMLILTEEDIENKNEESIKGAGYEILVIPNKYKDTFNEFVNFAKIQTLARCGEIIYV